MKKLICLDTETTGLNHKTDRIVEIGCVDITNGLNNKNTFQQYLNPGIPIPSATSKIHGITDETVKKSPKFSEITINFLRFIKNATLIIHNAKFDVEFLNSELERCNLPILENEIIDTVKIAKEKFPGQKVNLDSLMKKFKINTERTYHGALLDAEILAEVYTCLMQNQSSLEMQTEHVLKRTEKISKKMIEISKEEEEKNLEFFASPK